MSGSYGFSPTDIAGWAPALQSQSEAEAGLLRWFAVQTRPRFEKTVVAQLSDKGCDVYLPLQTQHHTWSDRQKVVTVPLFPGYAFVHIDQSRESRQTVLKTVGLVGFVSFRGIVVPVPSKQIDDLRLLLQQRGMFSLHPFVRTGQRVRIRGGCLHGLEGVLLQNEKGKLLVSIDSLQRTLAIEIRGYELELV